VDPWRAAKTTWARHSAGVREQRGPARLPRRQALQEVGLAAAVGAQQAVPPPDRQLDRAVLRAGRPSRVRLARRRGRAAGRPASRCKASLQRPAQLGCLGGQSTMRQGRSLGAFKGFPRHSAGGRGAKGGGSSVRPGPQAVLKGRARAGPPRACMSSTPLRPMLKPSILMSRLVGREVSTPVTVRVCAAASRPGSTWPLLGSTARLARLSSLCARHAGVRRAQHGGQRRAAL